MLGGFVKLTLVLNVLFLFIVLLWQSATIDASPILANNGHLIKFNDDLAYLSAIDHKPRGMKKSSSNSKHRASKRVQTLVDDRLKRFRMLDPDEFQEMLNSWTYQAPDHSVKEFDNMDTLGGMQLENYWLRK